MSARFPSGFYLDCDFGFDRSVVAQRRHADRRPRMFASLAPELDEEIRRAVDDLGHFVEAGSEIDIPDELDNSLDAVEIAERFFDDGEMIKRAVPGHFICLLYADLVADFPAIGEGLAVKPPDVSPDEQNVSNLDERNVVRRGYGRTRKFQPES